MTSRRPSKVGNRRLMSRAAAAAALALAVVAPCGARGGAPAEIDAFVEAEMRRQHIPGMALAVVRDGKVVVAKGYGLANVEHGVSVNTETVFQSG